MDRSLTETDSTFTQSTAPHGGGECERGRGDHQRWQPVCRRGHKGRVDEPSVPLALTSVSDFGRSISTGGIIQTDPKISRVIIARRCAVHSSVFCHVSRVRSPGRAVRTTHRPF
jgi:hypothetical protein